MKKFLVIFLTVISAAGFILFTGCGGGGGTKVNSAADEEGQVMDEASQKSKEELPTTYMVEAGDTLSTIAEKAAIYGNKYQWPLIFDANKDILDDYKTIKEGQKLIIPRNVSAVEIEAAKQHAEEVNWPPAEGKLAATGKEAQEENGEEGIVAGINHVKSYKKSGNQSVAGRGTSSSEGSEIATEEPTPIPEPGKKANKKSGPNTMMLLLILLGVIAVIVWFMMSQKKKKDEEDDKEDKSDNNLG